MNFESANPEKVDEQRRKVLHGVAAIAGVAALSRIPALLHTDRDAPDMQRHDAELQENSSNDVTQQTLLEQLKTRETITLNEYTLEAMYQQWYETYAPNGKRHRDLFDALKRIRSWIPLLQQSFIRTNPLFTQKPAGKNDVDPESLYLLCLPESHFQNVISPAGAVGPYQFMRETARSEPANLLVCDTIDDRCDPELSALGCARLLASNYRKMEDMKLAVSAYNGGYPWQYLVKTKKEGGEPSYTGFLSYLEQRINTALQQKPSHTVKNGETLFGIATQYSVTEKDILERNSSISPQTKTLQIGQSVLIPLSETALQRWKLKILAGFIENITYPVKFQAIVQVLKDYSLLPQNPDDIRNTYETRNISAKYVTPHQIYTTVRFETETTLANKFSVPVAEIKQVIRDQKIKFSPGKKRILESGQTIRIPRPKVCYKSLEDIAREQSVSLERLKHLNPRICKERIPLQQDTLLTLRFPKKASS